MKRFLSQYHYLLNFMMLGVCWFTASAQTITPADFAKSPAYFSAKISPSGDYLAVGTLQEGKRKLMVLDAKTFQPVRAIGLPHPREVGEFYWVNDERIVFKVLQTRSWESQPRYFGELFATNFNGSKAKMIFGYSAEEETIGSNIRRTKATEGWAEIESFLEDSDRHILISSTPLKKEGRLRFRDNSKKPDLFKLNVYTGNMTKVNKSPIAGADFSIDNKGNERFATGIDEDGSKLFYQYDNSQGNWSAVSDITLGSGFEPLAFDATNENLFYLNDSERDTRGLYKYNLSTGDSEHIYTDEKVDVTSISFNKDFTSAYAMRTDNGYPEYLIFDKTDTEAVVFRSLLATFTGLEVSIISSTQDNQKWVVSVSSDTTPGAFYLFDQKQRQLQFLFDNLQGLPEKQMATTKPVTIKVSDGTEIPAYLTQPAGVQAPVPLVTLVHGEPHSVRDYWGFDHEVQMLANQGYAVLRVNYRGSDGYGRDFEVAGHKKWGGLIQQDIIDATNWAREQAEIDASKVCIMGEGFGGYSAVQASILAGNVFKCAVATAGIYNLENLYVEGDIPKGVWGESFLETSPGLEKETLRRFSPVNGVAALKAPLLIAHTEEDRMAPFAQAKALREAAEKAKKPFEWFVLPGETHGFHGEDDRGKYYEKVAAFLAEHLK